MTSESRSENFREALSVFSPGGVPMTTPEVAEALDRDHRSTYDELTRLLEHDRLRTREIGESTRIWWRPPEPAATMETEGPAVAASIVDDVLEDTEIAIFVLGDDYEVVWINEAAERYFRIDREAVVGRDKREVLEAAVREAVVDEEAFVETVLATYADNSYVEEFECRIEREGGDEGRWLEHHSEPIESGRFAGGRVELYHDITERKQTEHTHEQFESLINAVEEYAIFTLDVDGHIETWNPGAERIKGYESDEILGEHFSMFYTEESRAGGVPERNLAAAAEEESIADEGWRIRADGSKFWANVTITAIRDDDDGDLEGFAKVTRDMTQRHDYERQLEAQREQLAKQRDDLQHELDEVFERIDDAFFALDEQWRFTYVNDRTEEMLDRSAENLVGKDIWEEFPEMTDLEFYEQYHRAIESQEPVFFEAYFDALETWFEVHAYPSNTGLSVYIRDVTERKERERELERRQRQQQVVADLGRLALETEDPDELMAEVSRRVSETLETDYSRVLDLDPAGEELLLRQGVGWKGEIAGSATVAAHDDDSQAGHTLASEEPIVVEDLGSESRFSGPELLTSHDVKSGISTIIGSTDDPWGILGTHDTKRQEFSEEDVNFVQSVANVLATAIDRADRERQLEAQRERLAALNDLYQVIQGISETVIEQSTREEIEKTVCERLAGADAYEFAWIADVDPSTQQVTVRAEAGTGGYLDEIEISIDPEDPCSDGPTGQAYLTGEVHTVTDTLSEQAYGPWRETASEYGVRSSAAVPIVHEGTIYGVLNVYAERPNAFANQWREPIAQLGEIVGHSIAAAERKRALMSDELVEVQFRVRDLLADRDVSETGGTITIDQIVPVGERGGEEEYLVYGTATADAEETLEALVEATDRWTAIEISADHDGLRFKARIVGSPLAETVVAHGGIVETARIEDGNLLATVHLSGGADVRQLLEAIEEHYNRIDPLTRRQIQRSNDAPRQATRYLLKGLTNRQRTVLETAYHSGYYEWPREISGKELADQLDISSATFSQHLRAAQQGVFEAIFDEAPTAE